MRQIKIGIIGFGTVGSGTMDVLLTNREIIADRIGAEVVVKKIADVDIQRDRGLALEKGILTTDAMEVIDDPEIDVVVELMGGLTQSRDYILAAIERGKHVVTANKALLAEKGREIYEAARRAGVGLAFEASVCGGIPVIRALSAGLSANRIEKIIGILNGTSNYILTKMTKEGLPYPTAVKEAVDLGYAEDPPTLDVDGTDAAHKLAILISIAHGHPVAFEEIHREGIDRLTPEDIRFADEFGYHLKLLAIAEKRGDRVEARVHPALIPKGHILSTVDWAYNALYLEGDFVGPNLYYGLGAGRNPTGSAVVSDIMELARQTGPGLTGPTPPLAHARPPKTVVSIQPIEDLICPYYFRFSAVDRPGVLSRIAGILGKNEISISSVIQKGREVNGSVPVVMLTHEAREESVQQALREMDALKILMDKTIMIRVAE